MPTVSEQLQQARLAQKLTLQQAAEVTKIRTDHLRALEEADFDIFSAPVYIKGFVRSYAGFLKLDVPQVMRELEAELAQTAKFAEPPPLTNEPKGVLDFFMLQFSKLDWRAGAVLAAAVLLLVIIGIVALISSHHKKTDPLSGLKPGLYHPTQHYSGETLPINPATQPPRKSR